MEKYNLRQIKVGCSPLKQLNINTVNFKCHLFKYNGQYAQCPTSCLCHWICLEKIFSRYWIHHTDRLGCNTHCFSWHDKQVLIIISTATAQLSLPSWHEMADKKKFSEPTVIKDKKTHCKKSELPQSFVLKQFSQIAVSKKIPSSCMLSASCLDVSSYLLPCTCFPLLYVEQNCTFVQIWRVWDKNVP